MVDQDDEKKGRFSLRDLLIAAGAGGVVGFGIAQWLSERERTSFADEHYPEWVAEIAVAG